MLCRTFQKWICSFEVYITLGNIGVPEGLSSFTKNHFTVEMYGCNIWPIWWEVRCSRMKASHEWCPYLHQSLTGLCLHKEIYCEVFDDIYIVWHPPLNAISLVECLFWFGDIRILSNMASLVPCTFANYADLHLFLGECTGNTNKAERQYGMGNPNLHVPNTCTFFNVDRWLGETGSSHPQKEAPEKEILDHKLVRLVHENGMYPSHGQWVQELQPMDGPMWVASCWWLGHQYVNSLVFIAAVLFIDEAYLYLM
jgi:hypothetical protein